MPNNGYFDTPFAVSGDKAVVPDAVQVDGSVSYTTGFGIDYSLNPVTNPSALRVPRNKSNQIYYDITSAIKQYQENGIPPFITSSMTADGNPFPYAKYAQVLYSGTAYQSLVNDNTDTPPTANWAQIGLSVTNVFTGGTTTGNANVQALASVIPAATSFGNGQQIVCTAGFTNTGATTFQAPGESPIAVKKLSGSSYVALSGGEITASATVSFTKNIANTCWVVGAGAVLGTMASLNISGNSGGSDGAGNYAPFIYNQGSTVASKTYGIADWGNLVKRSHSGVAMTDSLPGTSGAMPNGWYIYVENVDAVTDTISVGGGGVINQGSATGPVVVSPNETWIIESAGSGAYNAFRIGAATAQNAAPVQSAFKNLSAVWLSNNTANLSADQMILQDGSGNTQKLSTLNNTADITASGVNGLDTGSVAPNTWYALYAIYNPSTLTKAALFSASFSTPTLPAGYTFASGPVSAVLTDGSNHLIGFSQKGARWQYRVGSNLSALPTIATGPAGTVSGASVLTWGAASISAFLPPNAESIRFSAYNPLNVGLSQQFVAVAPNNSYVDGGSLPFYSPSAAVKSITQGEFLLESTNIYWAAASNASQINCIGCDINI